MIFKDRQQAGVLLAQKLKSHQDDPNAIVLGLPRGGVPVAYEIAKVLNLPLDALLVRKLGVPGEEELAMGAIALGGTIYLNNDIIRQFGIRKDEIKEVLERENRILDKRNMLYRQGRKAPTLAGKIVILVDDGLATGATMRAAISLVHSLDAQKIIVAVPVAPITTLEEITRHVDQVICLSTPEPFYAVGTWYEEFSQVSDEEVCELLQSHSL